MLLCVILCYISGIISTIKIFYFSLPYSGADTLNININKKSSISLVQQIYESLLEQIQDGHLEKGKLIPSIRGLAKQLDVSMVTVSKAYSLLEKEGSIKTVRGKGTFVWDEKNEEDIKIQDIKVNNQYDWQAKLADYLPSSRTFAYPSDFKKFSFESAKISPGLLAGTLDSEEAKNVFRQYPSSLFSYGDIQGDEEFRNALTAYFATLDVETTTNEILITNGVQQGIDLVARTFLGHGDIVIMETPAYSPAIEIFRSWGATILSVPIDEHGMQVDYLEELCLNIQPKLIYTNPTFQNPTGIVLSKSRREKLLHIAQKHQILIVEDDSWSELYFGENPPMPIKSMDEKGHVIYLKGFSKWLSPGCRLAALTANGTVLERLLAAKRIADLGSPLFIQKMMELLLQSESLPQHIDIIRNALSHRSALMMNMLKEHAPPGITWTRPAGGLNLWVTCPPWFNTDIFLHKLIKEGIFLLPGSACYPTETEYNHIRFCFSFMSEEQIEKGMKLFCDLLTQELTRNKTIGSPLF